MAREREENFKEMELWEHLAELRARLIRSVAYVGIGMVAAWIFFDPLFVISHLHWPCAGEARGRTSCHATRVSLADRRAGATGDIGSRPGSRRTG